MALEDVADVFGDGIVLLDVQTSKLHQQFKQSHYKTEVFAEVAKAERSDSVQVKKPSAAE